MTELEETIGWTFRDPALLALALTTPSCRQGDPRVQDNQRLEFLGDAVFGLLMADRLYRELPEASEGLLTQRRAHHVSGAAFAAIAEGIGLRAHVRRNAGLPPLPPRAKPLADALEALMGAVWLDGGLEAARAVFARLAAFAVPEGDARAENPKGYLLVRAQAQRPPCQPVYETLSRAGTPHEPLFTVRVRVRGMGEATAVAGSKNAAETAAAAALLARLDGGKEQQEQDENP